MTRQDYTVQWNSFLTVFVNSTLAIITGRISQQGISVEWMEKLSYLKFLLEGTDVRDVKTDLTQRRVTDDTLDKTEKIYTEIERFLIDISVKGESEKEFLKKLSCQFEHYRKQMTKLELSILK